MDTSVGWDNTAVDDRRPQYHTMMERYKITTLKKYWNKKCVGLLSAILLARDIVYVKVKEEGPRKFPNK